MVGVLLCLAACARPSLQQQIDLAPAGALVSVPKGAHRGLEFRRTVTLVGQGNGTQIVDPGWAQPGLEVTLASMSLPTGLDVPDGATAQLERVDVGCQSSGASGLRVKGALAAQDVTTSAACGWGLDLQGGSAVLSGGQWKGQRGGVRAVEGKLSARGAAFEATQLQGSAFFAARSDIVFEGVTLSGGEHGLLMRDGSLSATALRLHSSLQAGVALVATTARLARVEAQGPFALAALQVSEAPSVEVSSLTVQDAGVTGVLALRSTVELSEMKVSGARGDGDGDFGHAVSLQDARATIRGLDATDISGAAVFASDSTAQVRGLHARRVSAALVALRSEVSVQGMSVATQLGSVVYAAEGARVQVGQTEHPVVAACDDAAVADAQGASLCTP